jgi:hypothetical protein
MTRKHTLPAGLYFIGDPCYLIPDEDWDVIGDNTNWFGANLSDNMPPNDWDDGLYHWNGKLCFASHTKHGDGCFTFSRGRREIWVDSGTIGITPFDGNPPDGASLGFWLGGVIEEHKNPIEVWEEDGVFHIGKSVIRTT